MEYPGTKFTKKWRQSLLICTILSFFIISTITLLYAMGYRYDLEQKKITGRGSLSVDIEPKTGTVFLNNIELKKNRIDGKVKLNDIQKGKYLLQIKTDGFHEWTKEIEVENNKTVYIKEINLLKKNELQKLLDIDIKYFNISPNGKYVTYISQNDFVIKNILENKQNQYIVKNIEKVINISWDNNEECGYLHTNIKPASTSIYVFCPDKNNTLKEIEDENSPTIKKIYWNDSNNPQLLISNKFDIYSYDPLTGNTTTISKNIYHDWYFKDNSLWTIDTNTSTNNFEIIKDAINKKDKYFEIVTTDKKEIQSINKIWSIEKIENDIILLNKLNKNEILLIDDKESFKLSGKEYIFSTYNDWWIIWSDYELWTFLKGQDPYLISRSGENIKDILTLDKYNTIGMVWPEKITALFPYYLVSNELINSKIQNIQADHINRKLYFTKYQEKGLWTLDY